MNKVINYAAMVCAIIAAICFCIDKDWDAALWAMIAFIWMVDCHLAEDSYYNLDKLTEDYCNTLIEYKKEIKELKDEIEKLSKGE